MTLFSVKVQKFRNYCHFKQKLLVLSRLQLELEHELIDLNQNKVTFFVNSPGLEKLKINFTKILSI